MAITYPGTLDTFTNPVGTNTLDDPDHALQHSNANDAIEAIEVVVGTTAGTNVLKDFSAGQFPARVNAGGTIVQTLTGGTINTSTFGTPTVTGGSFASPSVTGTDSGTATLENKTLSSPTITSPTIRAFDGWQDANETWTYASADDPTYTFTISGDQTSKYSAGMRIKLTQTTVKYFIITAVSYSDPDTTVTVYGGTDYDLANAAISDNYYSSMKAPQGFPLSPDKWSILTEIDSTGTQASPSTGVWYNLSTATINVPIGLWNVCYKTSLLYVSSSASDLIIRTTLSTANNTESDDYWTCAGRANSVIYLQQSFSVEGIISLTTKDTYYLNYLISGGTPSSIQNDANNANTIIKATCAYL